MKQNSRILQTTYLRKELFQLFNAAKLEDAVLTYINVPDGKIDVDDADKVRGMEQNGTALVLPFKEEFTNIISNCFEAYLSELQLICPIDIKRTDFLRSNGLFEDFEDYKNRVLSDELIHWICEKQFQLIGPDFWTGIDILAEWIETGNYVQMDDNVKLSHQLAIDVENR